MDGQTDRCYQMYHIPCFEVDYHAIALAIYSQGHLGLLVQSTGVKGQSGVFHILVRDQ